MDTTHKASDQRTNSQEIAVYQKKTEK